MLETQVQQLSSRLAAFDGHPMTAGSASPIFAANTVAREVNSVTQQEYMADETVWPDLEQLASPMPEPLNPLPRDPDLPHLVCPEALKNAQQSMMDAQRGRKRPHCDSATVLRSDYNTTNALLRKGIQDLMKLAVESHEAHTSQNPRYRGDEDRNANTF